MYSVASAVMASPGSAIPIVISPCSHVPNSIPVSGSVYETGSWARDVRIASNCQNCSSSVVSLDLQAATARIAVAIRETLGILRPIDKRLIPQEKKNRCLVLRTVWFMTYLIPLW